MKAVVVEIRKDFVAALSDNGCIVKAKNNNYVIGQVIELEKALTFKKRTIAKVAGLAASFVLLCAVGAYTYLAPSTYVSLDVNPSIEYSLNIFDRVLSVKAVNDDGAEILKQVDLKNLSNKKIDEAIKLTVDEISKEGYFEGDVEGGIVISTSGKDLKKAEALAERLKNAADKQCKDNEDEVEVEAVAVGKKRVQEAKALGVTPGKLNLVEKLKESAADPDEVKVEEWLDKPVKEIMKATKENRQANKKTSSEKENNENEQAQEEASSGESETSSNSVTSSEGSSDKGKGDKGASSKKVQYKTQADVAETETKVESDHD